MLVKEAIEMSDALNENKIPFEIKLKWLSDFETKIYNEVYATHEDCPNGFRVPTDEEDELLIEAPYDEVYVSYLRVLASFVCPRCPHYCNPCGDPDWIQSDCALALSARRLLDTASKSKTEAE